MGNNPEKVKKNKAVFYRKPMKLKELQDEKSERYGDEFVVEKIVELSKEQFQLFSNNLYGYYRFLYEKREGMYYDTGNQCMHCLLITTGERMEGVLTEAEGYAYGRYGAYVSDCGRLELPKTEVIKVNDLSDELPPEYWSSELSEVKEKQSKCEGQVDR